MPPSDYYTFAEVQAITDRDRRTIWRWRKQGKFPEPVPGLPVLLWPREDIDAWLRGAA